MLDALERRLDDFRKRILTLERLQKPFAVRAVVFAFYQFQENASPIRREAICRKRMMLAIGQSCKFNRGADALRGNASLNKGVSDSDFHKVQETEVNFAIPDLDLRFPKRRVLPTVHAVPTEPARDFSSRHSNETRGLGRGIEPDANQLIHHVLLAPIDSHDTEAVN